MDENSSIQAMYQIAHLRRVGRYGEGAQVARRALQSDPSNPELHLQHAVCLNGMLCSAEALMAVQQACALAPQYDTAHRIRAIVLRRMERSAEAVDAARLAVRIDPTDVGNMITLADCLVASGGPQLREAEAIANQCVRLAPDVAETWFTLAHVLLLQSAGIMGRRAQREAALQPAQEALERGLALDPNDSFGHKVAGLIKQRVGDTRAAGDHFLVAGRNNPADQNARTLLQGIGSGRTAVFTFLSLVLLSRGLIFASSSMSGAGKVAAFVLLLLAGCVFSGRRLARWNTRRKLSPEARRVVTQFDQGKSRRTPRVWLAEHFAHGPFRQK